MNLAFGPIIEHDIHTQKNVRCCGGKFYTYYLVLQEPNTSDERKTYWLRYIKTSVNNYYTRSIRSYFLEPMYDKFVNTYVWKSGYHLFHLFIYIVLHTMNGWATDNMLHYNSESNYVLTPYGNNNKKTFWAWDAFYIILSLQVYQIIKC